MFYIYEYVQYICSTYVRTYAQGNLSIVRILVNRELWFGIFDPLTKRIWITSECVSVFYLIHYFFYIAIEEKKEAGCARLFPSSRLFSTI